MQLLRAWSITCNFIKCFSNQLPCVCGKFLRCYDACICLQNTIGVEGMPGRVWQYSDNAEWDVLYLTFYWYLQAISRIEPHCLPLQLAGSLIVDTIHLAALSTCIMISQTFWVCLHLLTSPLGCQSAESQVLISTCTPSLWSRCIVPALLGSIYWIETITATVFNSAGTSKLGSTVMLVQSSTVFNNHAELL